MVSVEANPQSPLEARYGAVRERITSALSTKDVDLDLRVRVVHNKRKRIALDIDAGGNWRLCFGEDDHGIGVFPTFEQLHVVYAVAAESLKRQKRQDLDANREALVTALIEKMESAAERLAKTGQIIFHNRSRN